MLRIGLSLLCILFLASCKPRMGSGTEWLRWFDAATAQLPHWDTPSPPAKGLPLVRTDDHLAFRLDPDYRKRNNFCWDKGMRPRSSAAWRDLCVHRFQPEFYLAPDYFLKPRPLDPQVSDQHQSEEWEVGTVTFEGHRGIVERARVSGGIEGARRERRTTIFLEYRHGEWALLDGRSGDDAGYAELLGIAATIGPS